MSFDEIARNNDIPALKNLLIRDKCVNKTTGDMNNTVLHTAAWKGYAEMTNVLLEAGADITSQNKKGYTPAHIAANYGRLEVLKILLSHDGLLVEKNDLVGNTILHIAAWKGHKDLVEFLLTKKLNLTARNNDGNTVYHLAVLWKRMHILRLLLKHDKDRIDDTNKRGFTLLHLAAFKGYDEITQYLLSNGASMVKRDNAGKTAVQVAALKSQKVFNKFKEYKKIVSSCASGMASLLSSKRFEDNDTALHIAASFADSQTVIHQLVQNGANINARNDANNTPLHVAVSSGNASNITALLRHSSRSSYIVEDTGRLPIHIAAQNNDIDCLRAILKHVGDVNAVDSAKETALTYAIKHQSKEGVQLIVDSGGDPTLKCRNNNTCLHLSVIANNFDITQLILERNPEIINCQNVNGDTPLTFAVSSNSIPLTNLLLKNGADPHLKNNEGKSGYNIAISNGNKTLISLFENCRNI